MQPQEFKPRDYQQAAIKFIMSRPRCNIFAAPGMGKTSICLTAIDMLQLMGSQFLPVLIIGPLRVVKNVWPDEIKKWEHTKHMTCAQIVGTVAQRRAALRSTADVYVCNFECIEWLVNELQNEIKTNSLPFRMVICDESRRLKGFRLSRGTKRATALAKLAQLVGRWVNLTGTPACNGLQDLWGQQWFVDFGHRLGKSYGSFIDRWFKVDEYSREVKVRKGGDREIEQVLADCTLALRAEDWLPIDAPIYSKVEVKMPEKAQKIYDEMEADFFATITDAEIVAPTSAIKSLKLLQMANGAVFDTEKVWHNVHDAKIDALESLIEESGGEPIIVVYFFTYDVERITQRIKGARKLGTKEDEKDWNEGRIPVLLVHPKSHGHGLNLQYGGRRMVFLTNTWDLELRLQVIERIGPTRQMQAGFDRSVYVHDIVAAGTVDDQVTAVLDGKKTLQDWLLEARAYRQTSAAA